jgi:hypothetical protein
MPTVNTSPPTTEVVTVMKIAVSATVQGGVTAASFTEGAQEVFIQSLMDAMLFVAGLRLQREWITIVSIVDVVSRRKRLLGSRTLQSSGGGVDISYEIEAVSESLCLDCTDAAATLNTMLEKLADDDVATSMTTSMVSSPELSSASVGSMTVTASALEMNTDAPTQSPTVTPADTTVMYVLIFSAVFLIVLGVGCAAGHHYIQAYKLKHDTRTLRSPGPPGQSSDDDENDDTEQQHTVSEIDNGDNINLYPPLPPTHDEKGDCAAESVWLDRECSDTDTVWLDRECSDTDTIWLDKDPEASKAAI